MHKQTSNWQRLAFVVLVLLDLFLGKQLCQLLRLHVHLAHLCPNGTLSVLFWQLVPENLRRRRTLALALALVLEFAFAFAFAFAFSNWDKHSQWYVAFALCTCLAQSVGLRLCLLREFLDSRRRFDRQSHWRWRWRSWDSPVKIKEKNKNKKNKKNGDSVKTPFTTCRIRRTETHRKPGLLQMPNK